MPTADRSDLLKRFQEALHELPLIAILRGVRPDEAVDIGLALARAGFRLIEVPLNSPDPVATIGALSQALPGCLIGAGTVLDADQVRDVCAAGGRLVVSPNFDTEVVGCTRQLGAIAIPGVATPSEAFAALRAGADALKVFPAEAISPAVLKAWRATLPAGTRLLPVGGISPGRMADYVDASADGFGLGSALYRPGDDAASVAARALEFVTTWRALRG